MRSALSPALRACLVVSVSSLLACSGKPSTGSLKVTVNLEANTVSRCVKVFAEDADTMDESGAVAVTERSRPLIIGIASGALGPTVKVRAVGYTDEGCSTPAREESAQVETAFENPPKEVTLTLQRITPNDGGFDPDAGTDAGVDAGTDAGTNDDGGVDAGVDQDNDGVPLPLDCDDTNPNIRPGATELCGNMIDEDCDDLRDCADQPDCLNAACFGGGMCVGTSCMAPSEAGLCSDGVDNDGDNLVDCLDPQCTVGTGCSDFNSCTLGDVCVADGGCQKASDFVCPPPQGDAQCFMSGAMCRGDGGSPVCSYVPTDGGCNDGNACTQGDTCANGTCSGTPIVCNSSPGACFASAGACAQGACVYTPLDAGTGSCDDGNNCTLNDTCAGDGGCAGMAQTCTPPSECHEFAGTCTTAGACNFNVRNGQPCSSGTGTCNMGGNCVPNPVNVFPYTPTNFTEAQLPNDGGVSLNVNCNITLNTGTPGFTGGACVPSMPPYVVLPAAQNGAEVLLIRLSGLDVTSGSTLTIIGGRAVIFAVSGSANLNGVVRAENLHSTAPGCSAPGAATNGGGGGGGFGTAGGNGGRIAGTGTASTGGATSGSATLSPLRGGCHGLASSGGGARGVGGGAVQFTVAGTLNVNGTVTAPGQGAPGTSGDPASGGGGGSGGAILFEAQTLTVNSNARVTANGGGGAGGEDSAQGQAGTDGSETTATPAPGGPRGGSSAGTGGNGAAGSTGATAGGNSTNSNDGAGGGGGGVGRIRFNAATCTLTSGRVVSPAATSNGGTGCP